MRVGVRDAIAVRGLLQLRVGELVDELHLLDELTADLAADFEEVVGLELLRDPEGNVLEARRVLGVGLEGADLAGLELLGEALVV